VTGKSHYFGEGTLPALRRLVRIIAAKARGSQFSK